MSKLQRYRVVQDHDSWPARLAESFRSFLKGPYTLSSLTAKYFNDDATPSSTGLSVTQQTALTYSAFFACVNAISTDVASYPLIHYKRASSGGKDRYTDSRLYRMVHDEPNPEMTSFTMRQMMTAHVLTWGNAYAEIERDQLDRPKYLWPITPDRVTVDRDRSGGVVYLVAAPSGGVPVPIPAADMLHLPGLGFNGTVGYSVVAMARESIGLGLATEQFGGTFFGNGATFGGVVSYPGARPTELSDKNYREALEGKHQGVQRAHKLLALYNGAKYERMGIPPNDAQFLETRLHQVEEMCRWFRMPPHKIQHLLRSTNNNIEHQGIEYYTDTTRPWCVRWEQECNRKLISAPERRIQFFEHMIEGALRGDLPSRYAAYAVGRQWGWLSADDVRDKENMNPLPGGIGKVYLLPLNMTPADRINEIIDKQVAPTPAPAPPPAPNDDAAAAANARAEFAERAAAEARALAQQERERRIAAEATGTATAEELALRRTSEAGALALAAQLTQLSSELRARADQEATLRAAAEAPCSTCNDVGLLPEAYMGDPQGQVPCPDCPIGAKVAAEIKAKTSEQACAGLRAAVATSETAMLAAQTALTNLTAERDAIQAILDTRAEPDPRLAALETEIAKLTTVVAERTAHVEAAQAALAAAEARVAVETEARAAAETATVAERQRAADRDAGMIAAHRALIVDAMGRMVRQEVSKARQHHATPEKLRRWLASYDVLHEPVCIDAVTPALRAHLAWMGSTQDVSALATDLAKTHLAEFRRRVGAALETDPQDFSVVLDRVLDAWESTRADEVATVFMQREIDYARTR